MNDKLTDEHLPKYFVEGSTVRVRVDSAPWPVDIMYCEHADEAQRVADALNATSRTSPEPGEWQVEAAARIAFPDAWRARPESAGPYFEANRAKEQSRAKETIRAALRAASIPTHPERVKNADLLADNVVEAIHSVYLMKVREYDADFQRDKPDGFWQEKYGTNLHSTGLGEQWALREALRQALSALTPASTDVGEVRDRSWPHGPFNFGDRVEKSKGSSWHGRVCGWYSTSLTPLGYNVESEREPGSVQLYPAAALKTGE